MSEKTVKERLASIEVHTSYIRNKIDQFATKREVSIIKWIIGGMFLSILTIAGKLII